MTFLHPRSQALLTILRGGGGGLQRNEHMTFLMDKIDMYREHVHRNAKKLKGTNIGISEQFPEEIEAVRKSLYPELKKARAAGKQARIVKDKLIIEGGQVFINNTNAR